MKATVIGNLGKDSEVKTTDKGKDYVRFSVAESVGYGDKATTQWVNCTFWGERGSKLAQYLVKGTKVVVFGEVVLTEYTNRDGITTKSLECNVDDLKLVGGKKEEDAPKGKQSKSKKPSEQIGFEDDDIPF